MTTEDLSKYQLPQNRVIRRRVAARTTGVHIGALPPELRSLASLVNGDDYLSKHQIPEKIQVRGEDGVLVPLKREKVWKLVDEHAKEIEGSLLSGSTGKIAAFFSSRRQENYANFGRPTLYFSAFFHDYLERTAEVSRALASRGRAVRPTSGIRIGPVFVVLDTSTAAGFTALGHVARGAPIGDRIVVTDVLSTGAYEGASAYASAKLGVLAGAKAMVTTAILPIAGAHIAAFTTGIVVGAIVAVSAKILVDEVKDIVVDNTCGRTGSFEKRSRTIEAATA